MKPFTPKRFPWAGLLASGVTILSGFVLCLFVIMAFSDTQARGVALVVIVFFVIILIPVAALRVPRDPADKKSRRWWKFWRRRKRKQLAAKIWRRRRGQQSHQPFGTKQIVRTSTFVAAPRKPTEP